MAGHMAIINGQPCFIDYADAYGQATVDGKVWRWEFHAYCGPTFLRKDGEPRRCQSPTNRKVWKAFDRWLKQYKMENPKP